MEQKYVLTDETRIIENECIVHRIRAVRDIIVDGEKIVSEGDLGGWVERADNLSHDDNAWVCDNAVVCGNAKVSGSTMVCGDICIGDDDN